VKPLKLQQEVWQKHPDSEITDNKEKGNLKSDKLSLSLDKMLPVVIETKAKLDQYQNIKMCQTCFL